ncbi:hypothetical protein [Streptacidiphilus cavernicola]|uniref:Uncharacterized protein n=1 Tax=Streptacidiphilus cavernicola TaxID=3342716 RepID=A0ABV6VY72_9ACTN
MNARTAITVDQIIDSARRAGVLDFIADSQARAAMPADQRRELEAREWLARSRAEDEYARAAAVRNQEAAAHNARIGAARNAAAAKKVRDATCPDCFMVKAPACGC